MTVIEPIKMDSDFVWVQAFFRSYWGTDQMVSQGQTYALEDLELLVAKERDLPVGLVTYFIHEDNFCELMSLNALQSNRGIGSALLQSVENEARQNGCSHMFLITSNDNLAALRFYQRRGYRIKGVSVGAIDEARKIKPEIPLVGEHSIEIHDEIQLDKSLAVLSS